MARMFQLAGLTVLGFYLTGCVAQEKYNALKLDRDRLVEQLAQADAESRAARGEAELLKGQSDRLNNGALSRDAMIANLQQQISTLTNQNADLQRSYADALAKVGQGQPLPEQLNNALEQFAQQNPDMVDFDSARGMVKFKSDVTFATGSAEVTPSAQTAIGRFAQILNGPAARGYDLWVAGHTDNQRVSNPETIRKGHLDNWYLSAHRAISVSNQFQRQGITAGRIAVVGYGEQRPIAANATADGRQQNRRVEVLILPTQARAASLAGARQAGARIEANKDTPAPPPAAPENGADAEGGAAEPAPVPEDEGFINDNNK